MVRYLKRLKSSRLGRVQAFPMYGGLGMSAPSLHRESTDSLMIFILVLIVVLPSSPFYTSLVIFRASCAHYFYKSTCVTNMVQYRSTTTT